MTTGTLGTFLAESRARVDRLLEASLPPSQPPVARLHEAVRYALLGSGKRVRPILCLHTGEVLGASEEQLAPVACALEMIHCYSLIHDDLPAMDDDELRRGRATLHIAYDEATAILAGDALLTLAFETIAGTPDAGLVPALVARVARAAGMRGMVSGQAADLAAEGNPVSHDEPLLSFVHSHKTAALLEASVLCGVDAARVEGEVRGAFETFAEALGLAFQVADDILDIEASADTLGKTPGKDVAAGKLTYPAIHGLEGSKRIARELSDRACDALAGIPGTETLAALARYVVERSA